MSVSDLKVAVDAQHAALTDLVNSLRGTITQMSGSDMGLRDEVWRLSQHVQRTARIADAVSSMIAARLRREQLEASGLFTDDLEDQLFGVQPTQPNPVDLGAANQPAPAVAPMAVGSYHAS